MAIPLKCGYFLKQSPLIKLYNRFLFFAKLCIIWCNVCTVYAKEESMFEVKVSNKTLSLPKAQIHHDLKCRILMKNIEWSILPLTFRMQLHYTNTNMFWPHEHGFSNVLINHWWQVVVWLNHLIILQMEDIQSNLIRKSVNGRHGL